MFAVKMSRAIERAQQEVDDYGLDDHSLLLSVLDKGCGRLNGRGGVSCLRRCGAVASR